MIKKICIICMLIGIALPCLAAANKPYTDRREVRSFVDSLVSKHDFNRAELMGIFRRIQRQQAVLDAIEKPAERVLTWSQYRPIFIASERIKAGAEFWAEHAELLQQAEQRYGVPPEIIVAIIGVETRYGKYTGKHPVFDSLATLAFDGKNRQNFFRSELEHFLLLARDERFDPVEVHGSYAGAMGMPQFISSSYREYAVDFNQDGRRDLWNSPADVIGSVANYFKRHGWERQEAVAVPAQVNGDVSDVAVGRGRKGLKPGNSYASLNAAGVTAQAELDVETPVVLIQLEIDDGLEYWLGLNNFYVITRYNGSAMYALATYQLSQEIAKEYKQLQLKVAGGK